MKKIIAIHGNTCQDEYASRIARLINRLALHDSVEVMVEHAFHRYLSSLAILDNVNILHSAGIAPDYALSFGGDGTFLRTVAFWKGNEQLIIFGVNTGHLGYLSAIEIHDGHRLIDSLLKGSLNASPRRLLAVTAGHTTRYALNEVAILKNETSSMISIETAIDGLPLTLYKGDGLIISTPTGSTAYNLSVGGPIIHPDAPVSVLSPVAPHSLGMRPFVVSDTAVITAVPTSRTGTFQLSVDGTTATYPSGTPLRVTSAGITVKVGMLPGHNYIETLTNKMSWGC